MYENYVEKLFKIINKEKRKRKKEIFAWQPNSFHEMTFVYIFVKWFTWNIQEKS